MSDTLQAVIDALSEFRRQDDYLLAHGASLMSGDSHEIVHIDTLHRIVAASTERLERENEVLREQNFEMNKSGVELEKENAELQQKLDESVPRSRYDACNQDWLTAQDELKQVTERAATEIAELKQKLDRYTRMSESGETLGDHLDLVETHMALEHECTELRKKLEWQQIETAPRTGIALLLAQPWRSGYDTRLIGHYANGWVIHDGRELWDVEPTHWMPLPEPPL